MDSMHEPHVESLDLRSLRFLAQILETGSVTRAGEACGLTQSGASRALGRLRAALDDPLLVRGQQGHVLTARALELRPAVAEATAAVGQVFARDDFDPANTRRQFRVGVSEYSIATVVPSLVRRLRAEAPDAVVQFPALASGALEALEAGELDMAFLAMAPPPEPFLSRELFRERLVGVVSAGHPLARAKEVTLDDYLAHPHAVLAPGAPGPNPVDEALAALGRSRQVAVVVAHFSAAWSVLEGTDLVMAVPSRVAGLARERGLGTFRLPLDLLDFSYRLVWHQRGEGDAGSAWLRGLVG